MDTKSSTAGLCPQPQPQFSNFCKGSSISKKGHSLRSCVSKFGIQVRRYNHSRADSAEVFVVDITVPRKRHRDGTAKGTGLLDTGESGCSITPGKPDRCQQAGTGQPPTLC